MEEQMKLTIVGPLESELLQDFINGEPVSFQGRKGYKIYIGKAQKAKLEKIAEQLQEQSANALSLANKIRRISSHL